MFRKLLLLTALALLITSNLMICCHCQVVAEVSEEGVILLKGEQEESVKKQLLLDPKLREIFDKGLQGQITDREIALSLYDQLEPVSINFMIGRWKGSEFRTNHPMDNMLDISGWYGKLFQDSENVHPLLFYQSNGKDLFAVNPDRVVYGMTLTNFPRSHHVKTAMLWLKPIISTRQSKARLRMTEFRGKLSATMIYDTQPINDVFRRVDEKTVLGVMDMKGVKEPYFFVLERDDNENVVVDVYDNSNE